MHPQETRGGLGKTMIEKTVEQELYDALDAMIDATYDYLIHHPDPIIEKSVAALDRATEAGYILSDERG